MNRNDIIALANAGYTKDQINKLMTYQDVTPQKIPQAQPIPQAQDVPQVQPSPAYWPYMYGYPGTVAQMPGAFPGVPSMGQAEEKKPEKEHTFEDFYREVSGLKDMIATNNIVASRQPDQTPETSEQVLAEILDPMGNIIRKEGMK